MHGLEPTDIVYVSGPMSGLPDFNRPAFDAMARRLAQDVGCSVINPARHPEGWGYADYMRRALCDLLVATAVVLLPGHAASRGARCELAAAECLGLKVHVVCPETGAISIQLNQGQAA